MTFYVYTYFIDGVPRYVGKGVGARWKKHRRLNTHLGNALRKQKRDLGEWVLPHITEVPDEKCALCEEQRLIALYGREDLRQGTLWNLTDGGEGTSGRVVTKRTRQKIKRTLSRTDVKLKHSAATKGGMPPKKPKKTGPKLGSPELSQIISVATKEAMQKPEVKAKLKRSLTVDHRKNLSSSHMKLTMDQIRQIYLAEGYHKEIAQMFGISPSHVGCIKRLEREVYRKAIGEVM